MTLWPRTDRTHSALTLCDMGFAVFPVFHVTEKGVCSCSEGGECRNTGKHPMIAGGCRNATKERLQVMEWWERWPEANIGIATGSEWGLVVVDVDGPEGFAKRTEWMDGPTLTVKTGKEFGLHFYYLFQGKITSRTNLFLETDVRGEGGYVIGPGSNHYSGKTYEWEYVQAIARLPQSVVNADAAYRTEKQKAPIDWSKKLKEGERDVEITRRVGKFFQMNMETKEVFTLISAYNKDHCDPPLSEEQLLKIVMSIGGREKKSRAERIAEVEGSDVFDVIPFEEAVKLYRPEEVQWHIDQWLPLSTCGLIGAAPEMFKSWFLLNMAVSVATGRPFLSNFQVNRASPVIIVQQEDPMQMVMDRIARIMRFGEPREEDGFYYFPKAETKVPIYFHTNGLLNVNNPDSIRQLEAIIKRTGSGLVTGDPLYSMIPLGDNSVDAAKLMLPFKRIRDRTGCSFMFAHHHNKSGGGARLRDNMHGSVFTNAWLETGYQFETGEEQGTIHIQRHGKAFDKISDFQAKFNIRPFDYHVEVEETMPTEKLQLDRLKELLSVQPCRSQDEIAARLKVPRQWVKHALLMIGITQKHNGFYRYQEMPVFDEGIEEEEEELVL